MRIEVGIDATTVARKIAGVGKLTPQSMAKALNSLAYGLRVELVGGLDQTFTVRKRGYLVRGLRYTKATPQNLESAAGTLQEGLAIHDSRMGESQKKPVKGKFIGVPFAARPSKTAVTPRSKWPGALARKSGYFFQANVKSIELGLWRRTTKARYPIELVYAMTEAVQIPQAWPMLDTAQRLADKEFLPRIEREFDRAILASGGK